MQKNLPLVLELASKFQALTYIWQGQGKYHTNQQSRNVKGITM